MDIFDDFANAFIITLLLEESVSLQPSKLRFHHFQLYFVAFRLVITTTSTSKMAANDEPEPGNLGLGDQTAISIIERTGSILSVLGCIFIIVTFSVSKAFHKPINRLVFYASFGNMMTNIATLMARDFVLLRNSVGCQLQAFLIQM